MGPNPQHKSSFFNTINSNGVYSLINKPTRLSRSSSSTIDHILTNDTSNVILPCIILHDLTDHFPIACIIENRSSTKVKNKKANSLGKCIYRDFSYFDTDIFLNDLHISLLPLLNNQSCLSAVDVDYKFNIFIENFNKCVNKHVPLKTASRKKIRLMRKPWITKEIFTSIRHKQKMYIPYYVRGTEIQKMIYKQYSNKLTKIKTLSKKQYINSEINNTNNNMCKFWSLINTIIPRKPKQSLPNFLNINNTEINDPIQIAEYFNNPFSTIGKTLANKLASTSSTDFTTYLSNQVSPSIIFNPTCTTEITHIINHFNSNKSCGPDNINAKILKISLPVITPLLTSLCNDCLQYGVFLKCLKIAKVVPILYVITNQFPYYQCFQKSLKR